MGIELQNATLLEDWFSKYVKIEKRYKAPVNTLYTQYKGFCDEKKEKALSPTQFLRALSRYYLSDSLRSGTITIKRAGSGKVIEGIGVSSHPLEDNKVTERIEIILKNAENPLEEKEYKQLIGVSHV